MNCQIISLEDFAELRPALTDLAFHCDGTIEGTHPAGGRIRFRPICGFTGRGLLQDVEEPAEGNGDRR